MYSERARHTGNFNPRFLAGATSAGSGGGDIAEFQSTLPYGSESHKFTLQLKYNDFNPRSLTGATWLKNLILFRCLIFQSTLPYGSDHQDEQIQANTYHFNPRSLTGATITQHIKIQHFIISIHAPLRERHGTCIACIQVDTLFQSTLPYGSDRFDCAFTLGIGISIHAPLRERPAATYLGQFLFGISIHAPLRERRTTTSGSFVPSLFQSTLPYGSDPAHQQGFVPRYYFNPRSLTGATRERLFHTNAESISIHAPLRERLLPDIF